MKNKLLISIDGVRKDRLACYNPKAGAITPRIADIAKQAVVFDDMMAAATSTAMCFSSIFTGEPSYRFGRVNYGQKQNPFSGNLFLDHEEQGYRTLVSVNRRFREYIEMMNAFSRAEFHWTGEEAKNGSANAKGSASLRPMEQAEFFGDVIEKTPEPWLAWTHLWGFSGAEDEYRSRHGFDYDSRIAEMDAAIGYLFDRFRDAAVIAVFADHGYAFFEHDRWAYGIDGYNMVEPVVSVPFMIYDGEHSGRNTNLVTQLRIREIVSEPAKALRLRDETALCETRFAGQADKGVALRHGDFKLIYIHELDRIEFYDLATDPNETIDYANGRFHRHDRASNTKPQKPYVVRSDWDELDRIMNELAERARNLYPPVSLSLKERLRSLKRRWNSRRRL